MPKTVEQLHSPARLSPGTGGASAVVTTVARKDAAFADAMVVRVINAAHASLCFRSFASDLASCTGRLVHGVTRGHWCFCH